MVKWILRYIRDTTKLYGQGKSQLDGYTNAYMAGDLNSQKSTLGYMMTFSGVVSW